MFFPLQVKPLPSHRFLNLHTTPHACLESVRMLIHSNILPSSNSLPLIIASPVTRFPSATRDRHPFCQDPLLPLLMLYGFLLRFTPPKIPLICDIFSGPSLWTLHGPSSPLLVCLEWTHCVLNQLPSASCHQRELIAKAG